MRAPCCLNKRATPNGATPLIAPHYALRSLLSVASIPHAARISYHWTACAVNWLNFRRTGGSTCSGQVAQATPDRRLRRTGIFTVIYMGESKSLNNGINYYNAEDFLMNMYNLNNDLNLSNMYNIST